MIRRGATATATRKGEEDEVRMPTSSLRHRPGGTRAGDERRAGLPGSDPSLSSASPQAEEDAPATEIMVTARKRNERLQGRSRCRSPPSPNFDLREGNARGDLKDMLRRCPAMSFSGAELGQSRYSIRGVSTTSPSPTVGIYLDDIRCSARPMPSAARPIRYSSISAGSRSSRGHRARSMAAVRWAARSNSNT